MKALMPNQIRTLARKSQRSINDREHPGHLRASVRPHLDRLLRLTQTVVTLVRLSGGEDIFLIISWVGYRAIGAKILTFGLTRSLR
jgi:transposase